MVNNQAFWRWFVKPLVFVLASLPFLFLAWGAMQNDLGANPLEKVTEVTGNWALRILLLTLLITPLRQLTGIPQWLKLRRMLGLFAFFYACLHFLTWAWLDQELLWSNILNDILERPYVTVGFLSWLILLPLALTSTSSMMRWLGKRWKQLHSFVYLSALLSLLHYLWLVKADILMPMIYIGAFVVLMAARPQIRNRIRNLAL